MRSGTLVSMVGLLALASMAAWYFAGREDRAELPATGINSGSGVPVDSRVEVPSQPSAAAVSSQPAESSTTETQPPTDAHTFGSFGDRTEYATTPGATALPPELGRDDVEIDPKTGMMTVKRLPSEAPPMQQPAETVGPRDLPPDDVEIDPQTGQMTLKRYQQ